MTAENVDPTLRRTRVEETHPSELARRDFLTLAWKSLLGLTGLLGLGGLWRFLSYPTDPSPPTVFDLGTADAFPVGTRATIPRANAILLHPAEGLRAYSLNCPHLGCLVEADETGFACPCHGSRFHADGSLLQGPAETSLRELKIEISDQGHVILDTGQV